MVLVQLRKNDGDLPLPESVIPQSIVDGTCGRIPRRDAVSRSMLRFVLSPPLSCADRLLHRAVPVPLSDFSTSLGVHCANSLRIGIFNGVLELGPALRGLPPSDPARAAYKA